MFKDIQNKSPLYILIGNHDLPNPDSFLIHEHPFTALHNWANTFVSDIGIDKKINGKRFLFMPYVLPGRFYEALSHLLNVKEQYGECVEYSKSNESVPVEYNAQYEQLLALLKENNKRDNRDFTKEELDSLMEKSRKEILFRSRVIPLFRPLINDVIAIFAHQEFFLCHNGPKRSNEGDYWPEGFPFIITGHIHEHRQLQSNLLYTGIPFQHTSADANDKTVSFFSFTDGDWKEERISLAIPKRRKLIVQALDFPAFILPEGYERDIIKVEVQGTTGEVSAAMKSSKWQDLRNLGIKVVPKPRTEDLVNSVISGPQLNIRSYRERMDTVLQEAPELLDLWRTLQRP